MNKMIIVWVGALLAVLYFVYAYFIADEPPALAQDDTSLSRIEVIQAVDVVEKTDSNNDEQQLSQGQRLNFDNQAIEDETADESVQRQINRQKIIDLKNNNNINFVSLGELIEQLKAQKIDSQTVMNDLDRIKHNVEISKKMAALTKRLHHDVNGKKQLDKDVYAQLLEIQQQLLIPTTGLNFSTEN